MSGFQSFFSTSFSYSMSSSNGQSSGQAYRRESHSTPQGTSTRTSTQKLGEPMVQETRHYDSQGRELLGSGQPHRPPIQQSGGGRVEEIDESEADQAYREKMEGEYAKREGGA
ncbi:hypothetical protein SLS56_007612 [Neofusicoccum ribis]|uniref:Uncharacterized protein n=1 Tax=Neofusicoccum ribis TaxID=45134 RepID=A0ABR3SNB4_9PEZI